MFILKIMCAIICVCFTKCQKTAVPKQSYYEDTNNVVFRRLPQFQRSVRGRSTGVPCKCGETFAATPDKSSAFESEFYTQNLKKSAGSDYSYDYADDVNITNKHNDDFIDYNDQDENRIVNGYSVNRREFYVGLSTMMAVNMIVCGGILVSPRYVISAAHCFCASGKEIYCRKALVTSKDTDIVYRLVHGATRYKDLEGTRIYNIESVRQPTARIRLYRINQLAGPFDMALIKSETRIIFEPGRIMPICLGAVRDENVDAYVTGFGTFASMDFSQHRAECWTNHRGPDIFSRCQGNCSMFGSPQSQKCDRFFKFFGGVQRFRMTQAADVAAVGNEKCYAVDGPGEYGWCKTKNGGWGYCNADCFVKRDRIDDKLRETKPRTLYDKDCYNFMNKVDDFYTPHFDICGGQLAGRAQVEKNYLEYKNGKYEYVSTTPMTDETVIGGSDACQGDSGGPLVRYINVRQRGRTIRKGYLIGLVSRGTGCAYKNVPGSYVRIKSFLPWLRRYIEPENQCWNI